jgi:hypothetical protein
MIGTVFAGRSMRLRLTLLLLCWAATGRASNGAASGCEMQARFPANSAENEVAAYHQSRFEVLHCSDDHGGHFQILGFMHGAQNPTLSLEDHHYWVEFVLSDLGTLVIQLGSASHESAVYILQFQNGKPILVAKDKTGGGITFSRQSDHRRDYLIVRVPQFYFPSNPQIPDHVYRLTL